MKKKYCYTLLLAVLAVVFFAELHAQETYSKVAINPVTQELMNDLVDLGLTVDHPEWLPDGSITFYVNQSERAMLEQNEITYRVEIENYSDYYQQQKVLDAPNLANMQRNSKVANGFDLGSMGGFYTWDEMIAKLDEMKQDYPDLITTRASIGTTIEGREIWMAKISDNPNVDEEEPVAYFDAIHHAREPLAMATTINFMFWLLENYGVDPQVTYLVDNRELYFVPIVNPDGYEYNRATDPDGGGLWRKNRNPNDGSCFGVDLNRNYAFGYATNNQCSSPDPCSGVYRGEEPFSEAESMAVRDFMALIEPKTAFSIHSTAGSYLMPYGFDTSPPAFDIYSEWASVFLSENNYPYGVTFQMLGYTSCGTTRDYMHSEGIYGWTPEIDGQGFWPPESTIFDLVGENVYPLFYQSWISGAFVDVQSHKVLGDALPGESFALEVEVKNVGVGATAQDVVVEVEALTAGVNVSGPADYGAVILRARANNSGNPFIVTLDSNIEETIIRLRVNTHQDGTLNDSLEIPIYLGEKDVFFFDDASSGAAQWTAEGDGIPWGTVTDDAYSGTTCFGDSEGGNGMNQSLNSFELNETFDFTGTINPAVSLVAKYSIESNDFVDFQISTNNGETWETLERFVNAESWEPYFYSLINFRDETAVKFRFLMDTNGVIPADGFYFDNFEVANYSVEFLGDQNVTRNEFKVYPNPFNGQLTIAGQASDAFSQVVLYDLQGRVLQEENMDSKNEIQLSGLERLNRGVYFVKVRSASGIEAVRKIVKF